MADSSLVLEQTQAFYNLQEKAEEAETFAKMLTTADEDGNVGVVSDVTAVPRVQFNDGSSTRIHTNEAFNEFFAEFVKDNAQELFDRTIKKAKEMVAEKRKAASAEVTNQLDLAGVKPTIFGPLATSAKEGVSFSYNCQADHLPAGNGNVWVASGLPSGLVIDSSSGAISGTPDDGTAGSHVVALAVTSPYGTDTETLTITVAPGIPVITSATTASAKEGTLFAYQATADYDSGAVWSATGLPSSLTMNASTGSITGTPATGDSNSSPYTVSLVCVANGGTATVTLTLNIAA